MSDTGFIEAPALGAFVMGVPRVLHAACETSEIEAFAKEAKAEDAKFAHGVTKGNGMAEKNARSTGLPRGETSRRYISGESTAPRARFSRPGAGSKVGARFFARCFRGNRGTVLCSRAGLQRSVIFVKRRLSRRARPEYGSRGR